jgi:FecR protein
MKRPFTVGLVLIACALSSLQGAAAQAVISGCSRENSPGNTETLHCGAVTIVAEDGARYSVQDSRKGRVEAVELDGKALLIEVTPKSGGSRFQVITPQAIAAVRGTKWAVDVSGEKTSVFVVNGRVGVGQRTGGGRVTLGPGEGVDVEPGVPLTVKRWAQARVSALLARLGQRTQ